MAALTVQDIIAAGLTPAYAAANSTETIAVNDTERVFLHVKNGGGSPTNVTITAFKTTVGVEGVGNLTIADEVVAVAAGAEAMIGPFTKAFINASGDVDVAYSVLTSVTAGAFKLAKPV